MRTFGLVFKNMGFLFFSDVITRLLSFALFLVIARVLGQKGLGDYSFIFALTGIIFMINDLGISTLFVREASRDLKAIQCHFKNVLTMKLFFGFLAAVTTIIAVNIAKNFANFSEEIITAVYFAALAILFSGVKDLFLAVFQAFQRMFFIGFARVVEMFLIVSLGIYALSSGHGLVGLTLAFLLAHFIVFIMSLLACSRLIRVGISLDFGFQKKFLKASWPFWFTALFITLSFRTDTVMIRLISGAAETGLYNSSFRLLDALYFIPVAVISAVFPAMSVLYKTDKEMLKRLYRKMFYYLLAIALPMGIGTMFLADRIMLFIYGNEFSGAGNALRILIWAEVAIFLYAVSGYLLNAINRQLLFTATAAGAAVLNVAINLVLIPEFGYIGAAIATVATSFFILVLLFYFAGKSGYRFSVFRISVKPVIATGVMTLVLLALQGMHVLLIVPGAAVTYFAVFILLKGVEREEMFLVRKYLKRLL